MADAKKDNNGVNALIGTSIDDGVTPIRIKVDPDTHAILTCDDTTGSDLGNGNRDNNMVPVMKGVSSADGTTPVAIYADPADGCIEVNSN